MEKLIGGKVVLFDEQDLPLVEKYWWSIYPKGKTFYVRTANKGEPQRRMHRLILKIDDPKIVVDHINRNGLDNRRSNLRVGTQSQNMANVRLGWIERLKSGVYRVRAKVDGATKLLGRFATIEDAEKCRSNFELIKSARIWGEGK